MPSTETRQRQSEDLRLYVSVDNQEKQTLRFYACFMDRGIAQFIFFSRYEDELVIEVEVKMQRMLETIWRFCSESMGFAPPDGWDEWFKDDVRRAVKAIRHTYFVQREIARGIGAPEDWASVMSRSIGYHLPWSVAPRLRN